MLNAYRVRLPKGGSTLWLDSNVGPILINELDLAVVLDQVVVNWVEFEVSTGVISRIKYWNGSAWVAINSLKHWNGSTFVTGKLKQWNGLTWIE